MNNPEKLARLRERYANASGGDIFDTEFAVVARSQFTTGDKRKWPFAGIPTLLDAPCRPEFQDLPDFGGLDIALLGVPMDLGVTNRNGSRFGPRAVRTVERIGPYDHVLKCAPFGMRKIADIGDVPMQSRYDLAQCHHDIEQFYKKLIAAGVSPLSVGGDHSITSSILRALGEKQPVGMIHIDAHCDTAGPYEGAKFQHGGPFRLAVLDGVLDPDRTIQIGIRGGAEYLWEFSYESGMTVIHAEEIKGIGMEALIARARQIVGTGPTYISFDIDSIDPGFAPGTGTPEVGGLMPREVLELLRGLKGLNVVGADVVEVAPQYDATTNTAQIAAQMLFTILCLMVHAKSEPAGG
ncbi:agmatinase (plasmid) [Rhizobium leguminosarum bv. trifolii WSM2304]|uniref:Agmatinase n=1 Tax=Rhizobium leguminosarum bv. trifolii (strain WSM2304) TaxID=395492 RepID=A0ABF7QV21_RHILW|nr:agmatinase [Rhizobium leguminosarum]ACI58108.1 agmatinase [Rhizobium leguminosarum bv. trifolii WSM2304]